MKTDSCYHVSKWWVTYVCIVTWITPVPVSWGNAGLQSGEGQENINITTEFRVTLGKDDFCISNFHCHVSLLAQWQRMCRLIWKVEGSDRSLVHQQLLWKALDNTIRKMCLLKTQDTGKRLHLGWWTHNAVYTWCVVEPCTNHAPINSIKRKKLKTQVLSSSHWNNKPSINMRKIKCLWKLY